VPPGTVHLWLFRTDLAPADLARLGAVLDDAERRRAAGISDPTRRRRFVAAHAVARVILGGYLAVPARQLCWVRTANGKPRVAGTGLGVNLSHSGALGALAVTAGRPVGVDVQQIGGGLDPVRMARRYFTPDEACWVGDAADVAGRLRRFTVLWVRKEACVKAAGARLTQGLGLPVRDRGLVCGTGALRGSFLVRDVPVPAGFQGAVALRGDQNYRVRPRRWTAHPPTGS
jgi:4'-phosphopantetheinyl transferase